MSCQPQYTLPDLLATWPWKRVFNAMLGEVRDEANAWVESLGLFEPAQLKKFNACDFSKLIFQLDSGVRAILIRSFVRSLGGIDWTTKNQRFVCSLSGFLQSCILIFFFIQIISESPVI